MMSEVYNEDMELTKPIFIITGPSASGKSTIALEVLKSDLPIEMVVTTTTRTPRKGEVDGIDHHFVDKAYFESLIEKNEMFEWNLYNTDYYGSRNRDVEAIFDSGKYPLWDVDLNGAEYLKKHYPTAKIFFVAPESLDILKERLEERKFNADVIAYRLGVAKITMTRADDFDYKIINIIGKLDESVAEVIRIIKSIIS
jgi:guanylate kinase